MKGSKELYYQLYLLTLTDEQLKRLYCSILYDNESNLEEKLKLIHQEIDYRKVIKGE